MWFEFVFFVCMHVNLEHVWLTDLSCFVLCVCHTGLGWLITWWTAGWLRTQWAPVPTKTITKPAWPPTRGSSVSGCSQCCVWEKMGWKSRRQTEMYIDLQTLQHFSLISDKWGDKVWCVWTVWQHTILCLSFYHKEQTEEWDSFCSLLAQYLPQHSGHKFTTRRN